jgi:hypothetical protein
VPVKRKGQYYFTEKSLQMEGLKIEEELRADE